MKTQTTNKKSLVIAVFLALLLFNGSALRCEDTSNSMKAQSRATYAERRADSNYEPELQNDKSRRFEVLEWLVMQSLMSKYQKMEIETLDELD